MKTVGIICEYNPLHLGHAKQISLIRQILGEDTAIVCLMSGNFVQRGAPAIFDKSLRAKAAIQSGADLVLELPTVYALSSAEGFAAGGVSILAPFCDFLCFGAETNDKKALMNTARALLSKDFPPALRLELDKGLSFPAARAAALTSMGLDASLLNTPNNILAVEYCKAILSQNAAMEPLPILRQGNYHDEAPDPENPSATALRNLLLNGEAWEAYTPTPELFRGASLHTLKAGERAVLGKLRTMTDAEFEALPYGSEGLWRKLMHASRSCATLEEITAATKSKRYTRTRIDRMIICAYLGITAQTMEEVPPYARVLAFNDRGRGVLKEARKDCTILNAGEPIDHPYWATEQQWGDLYGLFAVDAVESPGQEKSRRVYYSSL